MASQGVAMPPNKRRDGKGAKSWGKNIKVLLSGRGTIMTSKFDAILRNRLKLYRSA